MSNWKDNVLKAHDLNKLPHFKIYAGMDAKGNPCFISDEDGDFNSNHSKLEMCLDLIQVSGKYLVQFKEKLNANNNNVGYNFEVPYGGGMLPATQQPAVGAPAGYVSIGEVNARITKELELYDLKRKNEDYEKKVNELTEKVTKLGAVESPLAAALEMFKPYLPLVMPVIFGQKPQVGIAGVGDPQQVPEYTRTQQPAEQQQQPQQLTPEQQQELLNNRQRLGEVMNWLVEVKGGQTPAVDLLYKMMEKGKENPQLLSMLEGFLNT